MTCARKRRLLGQAPHVHLGSMQEEVDLMMQRSHR